MKWLIWSIRSWFCDHEWEYDEHLMTQTDVLGNERGLILKVSALCEKCGWHRKYKKF